jgi:hypothetical protein
MPTMQRSGLLFAAGGDVLAKYGTLVRRYQIPQLGGEGGKEVFARVGPAWAVGKSGLLVPSAANFPRVEYAIDPVTLVQQPYLLLEAAGTNLIENSDYEADAVGTSGNAAPTLTRDGSHPFNGAWGLKVTTANANGSGPYWTLRAGGRIAAVAATTYTLSVWVWAPAASVGKIFQLQHEWYNAGGAIIGSAALSGDLVFVAGWQRFTFTSTAPANTVTVIPYFLCKGAQGIFDFWVDVPQFEASGFATSAIPTGLGAVTRNADNCTIPWYIGPRELWMYLRFIERGGAYIGTGTARLFGTDGGGDAVRVMFYNATQNRWGFAYADGTAFSFSGMTQDAPIGSVIELLGLIGPTGVATLRWSINGGAEQVAGSGVAATFPAQFDHKVLGLAVSSIGIDQANEAISRALVGTGAGSLVTTLADARAVAV